MCVTGIEHMKVKHTRQHMQCVKQELNTSRLYTAYPKRTRKKTIVADEDNQIGTVGCVAVDNDGNLATATSIGGFVDKMVGRIGDMPIISAGTYANSLCAVSATGKGKAIM
ncbi:hypothetical protein ACSBR2_041744 [Camellia fascicularis]